jgi:hypothetical protein
MAESLMWSRVVSSGASSTSPCSLTVKPWTSSTTLSGKMLELMSWKLERARS